MKYRLECSLCVPCQPELQGYDCRTICLPGECRNSIWFEEPECCMFCSVRSNTTWVEDYGFVIGPRGDVRHTRSVSRTRPRISCSRVIYAAWLEEQRRRPSPDAGGVKRAAGRPMRRGSAARLPDRDRGASSSSDVRPVTSEAAEAPANFLGEHGLIPLGGLQGFTSTERGAVDTRRLRQKDEVKERRWYRRGHDHDERRDSHRDTCKAKAHDGAGAGRMRGVLESEAGLVLLAGERCAGRS
jgi:hypothetical protein